MGAVVGSALVSAGSKVRAAASGLVGVAGTAVGAAITHDGCECDE